eukprot:scaffold170387_cov35-Prasinocladus_malaysianus.AAC.1
MNISELRPLNFKKNKATHLVLPKPGSPQGCVESSEELSLGASEGSTAWQKVENGIRAFAIRNHALYRIKTPDWRR